MLNNIYNDFKYYLTNTFPDIKIDEYRGEFEDKFSGGWNPSFPCCLMQLAEYAPVVRASSNEIIKHKAEFTLHIAEKNSFGFELIQLLIDDLNSALLAPVVQYESPPDNEPPDPVIHPLPAESGQYYIEVNSVKFFKAINSVRVHALSITIF